MKKIPIIIAVVIIIALATVGIFFLVKRGSEDIWLCQNGVWIKHGRPSAPMPLEPCPAENGTGPIEKSRNDIRPIGGDQDEHGCYIAAGYSWCESKQKCLRNWEEICPPN